ncbi:MAG: helix-turn-helix domain-containing protein [Candidatus Thorarchaeota archaeon]
MEKCLINLPKVIEKGGRCDIFECLFGLKPIHVKIYFYTLKKKRTIKEIASHVNRDRTTTVRLVQKIIKQGLLEKETVTLTYGGLKNVYLGISQEIVKERVKITLVELKKIMDKFLGQDWQKIPD